VSPLVDSSGRSTRTPFSNFDPALTSATRWADFGAVVAPFRDQAEGRVDAIDSIGEGGEEYYLGGTDAPGVWLGTGSAQLGLAGAVDGPELRSVLAGLDPRDGTPLRSGRGGVRVAAFDLTSSAPKSVSVVFGVGDREVRDAVRRAHERAVREALAYVEQSAAFVRRGLAGAEVMQADGLVAAGFRHRTSRVGDPQLHTHVLVANLGRGTDGRWSALDGRRIYAHARTASFVYQAVLRAHPRPRGRVDSRPAGDCRDRCHTGRGAEGVQPAPGGDRGGHERPWHIGRTSRRGGGALHPTTEGPHRVG
jgi:hypothetical protein